MTDPGDMAELSRLQAENDALVDYCARLEAAMGIGETDCPSSGPPIPPTHWRMLAALMSAGGRVVTREALFATRPPSLDPDADVKVVDVQICKLRDRLKAAGLDRRVVKSVWGEGYRIAPDDIAALRAVWWS